MKNTMGIITTTKSEKLLKVLTKDRCMAAVPFGGRYRLIDFPLSNMVNAGINNIGIITSHKFRALTDHLSSGKEWGLNKKDEGLFILPSDTPGIMNKTLRVDLKDFYANKDYLERSRQKYVIISGCNILNNISYDELLEYHRKKEADITIIYKKVNKSDQDYSDCTFLEINNKGRVVTMDKELESWSIENLSLEVCVLKRELLLEILDVASESGIWDFEDLLAENIEELKIYGFNSQSYIANINSIENYYKNTINLLSPEIQHDLFFRTGRIKTKTKDGPPAKYGDNAMLKNALVASGCLIEGIVNKSILFRNVKIGNESVVNDSVIMQNCNIEENVVLENVILDKNVNISKGTVLKGDKKNLIVIGKNTSI